MSTKVRIIDIDLTEDVQKIITDEIATITKDNSKQIETFHAIQTQAKKLVEAKAKKSDDAERKMREVYKLIESTPEGVESSKIMSIVSPEVSTSSAFTLRMKTILRQEGNKYALIKEKTKYKFKDWNKED